MTIAIMISSVQMWDLMRQQYFYLSLNVILCLFKFNCGQKVAEVFLDSGQKYFGEINEGRIGRMKCFC